MTVASEELQPIEAYQKDFVDFCLEQEVLRFGEFTLKSGRKSPYFFNAGLFNSGLCLKKLGEFYAEALEKSGVVYEQLFGPAYKGITLVAASTIALSSKFNKDVPYTFNRKEAKDHGEGGSLVGASMKGKKVIIIDDVITAGTAIRESVTLLKQEGCEIVGVLIAMDREEKAPDSELSAIQGVEKEFGFPVISIIKLRHIIGYLKSQSKGSPHLESMLAYREQYGVL